MLKQACRLFVIQSLLAGTFLCAQPEIAGYLADLPEPRFSLVRELVDAAAAAEAGGFSSKVLEEAELLSFSTWNGTLGRVPVRLEVYETLSSMGAYSLFHWRQILDPDRTALPVDVGNRFSPTGLYFWRGPYFFQVSPVQQRLAAAPAEELVRRLAAEIEMENRLPVTISHLPSEGLEPESVRFYLGSSTLAENEAFPQVLLSLIGRTREIEIAYGKFGESGDSLFLIGYPTVALAQEYMIRLQQRMEDLFTPEGLYMKRSGVLVCLFVGPEARATEVLARVNYKPTVQWLRDRRDPRKEHITFFGLLTRAILGTGVFILMILAGGVVVGLTRYEFIRRFPAIYRRNEMTRLNLD